MTRPGAYKQRIWAMKIRGWKYFYNNFFQYAVLSYKQTGTLIMINQTDKRISCNSVYVLVIFFSSSIFNICDRWSSYYTLKCHTLLRNKSLA